MAVPNAVFDFIGVPFSLNGAWVAKNNLDGSFGTPVGLFAKSLTLDVKAVSDQAQANTQVVATASMLISVDWTLDECSIQFPVLSVLYAGLSSASSPTFTDLPLTNLFAQYFGLIAEALADGGSAFRILIPKSKVMSGIGWKLEYGKLVVPQLKGTGIYDPAYGNRIVDLREYPSSGTAINFPPSW